MAEEGRREGRDEGGQDRHGERMTKWQRAAGSGVRRTWGGEGVGGMEAEIRKRRVGLLKCSLSCGLSTDAQ